VLCWQRGVFVASPAALVNSVFGVVRRLDDGFATGQ